MVISGANAGGKTVVLKNGGLLSLMALSGLHVPARAARFPLYASVLADIGDRQSLAANLSTFTAHVANISRMIELCRAPALVLLDEVGTGTDPEEGSALGVAVVDHFRRECGAHIIATTHYSGLKMYAANEAGVLNASVEFDERTLEPTYRFIVGVAGSSSGLEIARRFGFPAAIIERRVRARRRIHARRRRLSPPHQARSRSRRSRAARSKRNARRSPKNTPRSNRRRKARARTRSRLRTPDFKHAVADFERRAASFTPKSKTAPNAPASNAKPKSAPPNFDAKPARRRYKHEHAPPRLPRPANRQRAASASSVTGERRK